MAWSEVVTEIQNPARKRKTNMTAKQIKFFGSKRQKAALKAKRKKSPRRHTAKKRHAKRTRPNPAPRKKKRAVARHASPKKRTAKKRKASPRRKTRRNPELVSFLLGNPAKGAKKVARSRRKKRATARHSNAGTRRRTKKTTRRHSRRRSNPAGIPLKDFAFGGAGVLGGFLGSAAIPQMILGGGNTGVTGYAVTAAAGVGLAILAHMFIKNRAVTFGVGAGAAANLLRRVISDQTPFGGYLSAPGMGDYMVANWGPPQMTDGLNSAIAAPFGTGVAASSGVSMTDMADMRTARPC
jgi:hypothetical protein